MGVEEGGEAHTILERGLPASSQPPCSDTRLILEVVKKGASE